METNINWKQKLSSRKLWCALISAVLGVVIALCGDSMDAETVGMIEKGIYAMIAYIFGESVVDAVRVNGDAKIAAAEADANRRVDVTFPETYDGE